MRAWLLALSSASRAAPHLEIRDEGLSLLLGGLNGGLVGANKGGVCLLCGGHELGNVGHGSEEGDSRRTEV